MFAEPDKQASDEALDAESARLVARFQAGEREAFGEIYRLYIDRVYTYLRLLLRDPHEAEDVVQQVFLEVMQALPRYERREQPFRAWLFAVVRNQAIKRIEKRSRVQLGDPAEIDQRRERPVDPEAESHVLDWIADRELLLFVERLPLPQRQVLLMRYLLDLANPQIAEILGRTPTDIGLLHHRALRFLHERLTAVGRGSRGRGRAQSRSHGRTARVARSRRFALSP